MMSYWVEQGEASQVLKQMPDQSVDALITDPPAGIGFMGKEWDGHKGGRSEWIAWLASILSECRRIMKSGAMGWVWALPRTSHWTATACEDAGLLVRDVKDAAFAASELHEAFLESLTSEQLRMLERLVGAAQPSLMSHYFGTGFPKSKALLKPAVEHWILVRAPGELRELRIDECRIGTTKRVPGSVSRSGNLYREGLHNETGDEDGHNPTIGRWPANVVLVHGPKCRVLGTKQVKTGTERQPRGSGGIWTGLTNTPCGPQYGDVDGNETVDQYDCQPDCPVRALDEQAGVRKSGKMAAGTRRKNQLGYSGAMPDVTKRDTIGDSGAASRFFYTAKSSTSERNAGLPEHLRNKHPTVKSIALMRHLVRLVASPGNLVLDPFMGSGSTGVAALAEGCRFVGVEGEAEYVEVALHRLSHAKRFAPDSSISGSS